MNNNLIDNIVCSKCGAVNASNAKFCIKCGNNLQMPTNDNPSPVNPDSTTDVKSTNIDEPIISISQTNLDQPIVEQPLNNVLHSNSTNTTSVYQNVNNTVSLNYLEYIIGALLKPFNQFKKEENKLNDIKNVSILTLIIVGVLTIVKLIKTMISTVRVTTLWSNEVKWVWENLKHVQYFKVISQSIMIYLGILVVIAGIYYLANLVIKENAKFIKLLGATVTAIIPFALASSVLSPLLSMIYNPLGTCITVIGLVYTFIILLELMNELIPITDKNKKIYFHVACLSIILIGGGFIAYKLILGSVTSKLGSLGSLLS